MSEDNKEPEKDASGEQPERKEQQAGETDTANSPAPKPEIEPATPAAAEAQPAEGAAPAAPADEPAANADAEAERAAKIKAAAEAREARARAKAAEAENAEPAAPKEPSPKQPMLDRAVGLIKERVAEDAVEESYINELDAHLPYIIVKPEHWPATAQLLKNGDEFRLNYLRNLSGTDQETHLEVAYHLLSLDSKDEYCVKVKTDREAPSIPSITPLWATANWNEREVYDLLGIDFPGHPDLRRIMMPDDWVGHPLRKDYEPIDPEV